jgi:hypothetical protein
MTILPSSSTSTAAVHAELTRRTCHVRRVLLGPRTRRGVIFLFTVFCSLASCARAVQCAYDVAAHRFRGRDVVTNFRQLTESDLDAPSELRFLASQTRAQVVDMLRKDKDTYLEVAWRAARGGGDEIERRGGSHGHDVAQR